MSRNLSDYRKEAWKIQASTGFENCAIQILVGRLLPTDPTEPRGRTLGARQTLEASYFLILSLPFRPDYRIPKWTLRWMQQIFTCQTITSRLHVSARTWQLRLNLNTLRSCGKHRAVEKCVVLRIKALNWVLVLCCAVLGQVNLYGQVPVVKLANARSFVNKLRRQIKRLINKRGGAWWRGWKFPLVFLFFPFSFIFSRMNAFM